MRILACSDIHDEFERFAADGFPDADLCIVAGDLTNYGLRSVWKLTEEDILAMMQAGASADAIQRWKTGKLTRAADWLRQLAERFPVYWISGNHDIGVGNDTLGRIDNCLGILDKTVEAGPLKLHGVSMAPCYDAPFLAEQWDYMTADEAVEAAAYDFEPVDVVVSHAPPYGCCDMAGPLIGEGADRHIGSRRLLDYIRRYHPKIVICGHVHEASGQCEIETEAGVTAVYNLARRWKLIEIP